MKNGKWKINKWKMSQGDANSCNPLCVTDNSSFRDEINESLA